jgi:hypothetical protein
LDAPTPAQDVTDARREAVETVDVAHRPEAAAPLALGDEAGGLSDREAERQQALEVGRVEVDARAIYGVGIRGGGDPEGDPPGEPFLDAVLPSH